MDSSDITDKMMVAQVSMAHLSTKPVDYVLFTTFAHKIYNEIRSSRRSWDLGFVPYAFKPETFLGLHVEPKDPRLLTAMAGEEGDFYETEDMLRERRRYHPNRFSRDSFDVASQVQAAMYVSEPVFGCIAINTRPEDPLLSIRGIKVTFNEVETIKKVIHNFSSKKGEKL